MSSRAHDIPRAVAIAEMTGQLRAGDRLTARMVMQRYDVSLRSAQRWLVAVDHYLVPLDYDESGTGSMRTWRKAVL